jgi:hypothetical protein
MSIMIKFFAKKRFKILYMQESPNGDISTFKQENYRYTRSPY